MSRSHFGPAAGTNQGPEVKLSLVHPPEVIALRREEMVRLSILSDIEVRGLYELLLEVAEFTNGEWSGEYANLIAWTTPPKPQQGRPRKGPSYERLRRILRDLEGIGLVSRDKRANAAQGQLRIRLPFLIYRIREWEKTRAPAESAQGNAQATMGRKAA